MHIDFRQSDILRLHEIMMSFAGYEYGGQYKTDDNVILEIDADGNRRIRFRPTSASETPKAMKQLELAYLDARGNANINVPGRQWQDVPPAVAAIAVQKWL